MLRLKSVLLIAVILLLLTALSAYGQVTPTSLTFTGSPGGANPASQSLAVSAQSGGSFPTTWTVTVSTTSGGSWLSATPLSGSGNGTITVSVNIAGLSAGTYAGTYNGTVSVQFGSNTPQAVSVTLLLAGGLTFTAPAGAANPASQTLAISVSSGGTFPTTWTATVATDSGGSWLSVSPASGSGSGSTTVSVNIAGLVAGTYSGRVTVTPSSGSATVTLVTLTITTGASLRSNLSSLTFTGQRGQPNPPAQVLLVTASNNSALLFTAAASTTSGGNWLSVSPGSGSTGAVVSVAVDLTGLAAGTYAGQVTLTPTTGSSVTISVSLIVTDTASQITATPGSLNLQATVGSSTAVTGAVTIGNAGSGSLSWKATASSSGGNWLSISSSQGATPATLTASANPASLVAGAYQGSISITDTTSNTSASVNVVLTVNRLAPTIQLSQAAFTFGAVQNGEVTAAQQLRVFNSGQGTLAWKLAVSSGATWLNLDTTSGSTTNDPATAGTVNLTVNPSGLAAGTYYAVITATADATNSPQVATVVLTVSSTSSPAVPVVAPGGMVFVGTAGAGNPSSQILTVRNAGGGTLSFTATSLTLDGTAWLSVTPAQGNAPNQIAVTAAVGTLKTGVYQGLIGLNFSSTTRTVVVLLVVRPVGAGIAASGFVNDTCVPSSVYAVSTTLPGNFSATQNASTPVNVSAVDNCGNPVSNATATATFSSPKDRPVTLLGVPGGGYTGGWSPQNPGPTQVTVRVNQPPLPPGSVQVGGTVQPASPDAPAIAAGGVVNNAGFAPLTPVSAGSIVAIFGQTLLTQEFFPGQTLPTIMGNLSVSIGGVTVPLFYAGPSQIVAQAPFELAGSTASSVVVTLSGKTSTPEPVVLGAAQPGVFTYQDGAVLRGAILDEKNATVGSNNPAPMGKVIQIFATGLGPVDQAIKTGAVGPALPPANVTGNVVVTIGGQQVKPQFAGLAPNYVGLYQVNAAVPTGLTPGDVPMYITVNGVQSNTVTLPVK